MRVIVCGGREFSDWKRLAQELDRFHSERPITEIIHGAARGADTLAGVWAQRRGIPVTRVPADWDRHGRRAGWLRNVKMANMGPGYVIAFPGGVGTRMMVKIAKERDIPFKIIT